MARRGEKVSVITRCGYDWKDRNISRVKLNERLLLNRALSTMFDVCLKLMRLKAEVDVVHVPYTSNSALAYPIVLAKKLFDIHYIICIMGGGMYPWKPKFLHRLLFEHADVVVAASETIRKEYEKRSGRRVRVIPPLIPFRESRMSREEVRKEYGFNNDDRVILSLGSIKKIKGSDTLLHAFLGLGEEYIQENNLKLVYAGEGPMRGMLAKEVEERGCDEYVRFLGVIPHQRVRDIYRLSDMYVIPSLFEGLPLSLLESMFNGLPIIGADVRGVSNLIKHRTNGLLFEKDDSNGLTERIKELVEDEDLGSRVGQAAKEDYLRSYKFDSAVSQYIELYAGMCKAK